MVDQAWKDLGELVPLHLCARQHRGIHVPQIGLYQPSVESVNQYLSTPGYAHLVEVGVEVRDGRHVEAAVRVVAAYDKVVVPGPRRIRQTRRWAWNGELHVQCIRPLKGRRDRKHGVCRPALRKESVVAGLEGDRSGAAPLISRLRIVVVDYLHSVDVEIGPAFSRRNQGIYNQ